MGKVPKSGSTGSTTISAGIANSNHSVAGEPNGLSILYPSNANKSAVGGSTNSYALNSTASPKTVGGGVGGSVLSSRLDNKQVSNLEDKHPYNLGSGSGSMMGGANNTLGQSNIFPAALSTATTTITTIAAAAAAAAAIPTQNYWMYPSRGQSVM
jgi:hypothetical protein